MGIEVKTSKYSDRIFELSNEEYDSLKKSISENGLYHPISINQDGDLLDGHHRLRACQELSIPAQFAVKSFDSEMLEELYVIDSNLARRQLNTFQACELALKKKPLLARIAEEHMKAGKTLSQYEERVHTDKELARSIGKSTGTFYKAEQMLQAEQEEGPDGYAAKQAEAARSGKISLSKAYNRVKKLQARDQKKLELAQAAERLGKLLPEKVKLLNRDMREDGEAGPIAEIPDNSIDLILSDPPYTADMLHLFESLAQFAARKLKPGGSVVFYYGQLNQPEIHMMFHKYKGTLEWYWPLCVKHTGGIPKMWSRSIYPRWKPMMWFTKGEESTLTSIHHMDMSDFIESTPPDKDAHPWAQSPTEAEFIIENLTLDENALVVDPFLGSGAFGIAAAKLGRYFVGIEIDRDTFEKAEINMAQALTWPPPPPLKKEE
jgi:ParB-like chromosome segregation protein Spo0J